MPLDGYRGAKSW